MKVILVAFVVIVAFASNTHGQKVGSIVKRAANRCMKERGVTQDEIVDAVMTPTAEWKDNPEIRRETQCFFECLFKMAFVVDDRMCYSCEKGVTMTETFMKGPDLEEMGKCLVKGIKQCCPGLQTEDCCKNHYDLIQCIYPICGEIIAQQLTGVV